MDSFRLVIETSNQGQIQEFSLNDLKKLPKTDQTSQVGCTQSRRGVSTLLFGGVLLKHLIVREQQNVPIKRLVFHAMDGETVTVETPNDEILVSLEENGAPLTHARGFPLRVILPGAGRVIKWVTRIQVVCE